MDPVLRPQTIVLVYWLAVVVIAAFCLRMACGICREDMPSWRRSFASVLFVTLFAYLGFDFTSYVIMRSMDGVLLHLPPGYSYNFWFREPLALKLQVISFAGMFRYLPFVVAVCAAGFVQVIIFN